MKTIKEIENDIQRNNKLILEARTTCNEKKEKRLAANNDHLRKLIFFLEYCNPDEEYIIESINKLNKNLDLINSRFDEWNKNKSVYVPEKEKSLKYYNTLMGVDIIKRQIKNFKYILE